MTAALPAVAAESIGTEQADPRRAGAAKVVTDSNPMADPKSERDHERVAESYQPQGLEVGEFVLFPQIEVEETFNSNVYAQENNTKSDYITTVRPELRVRSNFKEHALNSQFWGEYKHLMFHSQDDVLDGGMVSDGRYDLSRTSSLNATLELYSRHEDRGSSDEAQGEQPTPTRGYGFTAGGKTQQGLFTFEANAGVMHRDFDDVDTSVSVPINNDDRDRTEYNAWLRGGYELFPGYAAIAKLSANTRSYVDETDDYGFERDSYGGRVEAGVAVDLTQLIRGDFLVGYMYQDYADRRFSDPSGLAVKAAFNWTPSRMTLVVPALERSIEETTVTDASAIVRSSASVLVRHELARNIILSGYAALYYDEYDGTPYSAITGEASARVTYAFTRELYVAGHVGYKIKESDVPDTSYQQATVGVRLGVRY